MADILELYDRLSRTYRTAFRVEDIAESLISFDVGRPASDVRAALQRHRFRFAGVRHGGVVVGYVNASDLRGHDGACGDHLLEFDEEEVVSGDASLSEAIRRLGDRDRVFVTVLGKVGGVVTWSDLQKPAARMWLFGVVTTIEMAFTGMIETLFEDESWKALVPAGRLHKAQELLGQRRRLRAAAGIRLLDCLQFSDKGQLLARDEVARRILGFESKSAGDRAVRRLAGLRDSLAHSQDVVTEGWDVIVRLAENVDAILRVSSTFHGVRRSSPRR